MFTAECDEKGRKRRDKQCEVKAVREERKQKKRWDMLSVLNIIGGFRQSPSKNDFKCVSDYVK